MYRSASCPRLGKTLFVLGGALAPGAVWADSLAGSWGAHLQPAHDLHTIINLACLGVFVVVFAAMFYSIWKHRKSADPKAVHFHGSTAVEMIWTAIPFAILMVAAYPATKNTIDQDLAGELQVAEQQLASR